ncbi:MAG TPA: tail fiber domain-containing protein [Parafilimonas sp.]|nr:tail fiber domain-containing protein [Parafilimonas sp.]
MKKNILQVNLPVLFFCVTFFSFATNAQTPPAWKLKGNAKIDPKVNFLGTTDKQPVIFKTGGVERMRVLSNGKVGIGTKAPVSKLQVIGTDYVNLTSPGYFMIGDAKSYNIGMDVDVIQARINGAAASLYLNYYGGYTLLGVSGSVAINTSGNMTTSYPAGINGSYNSAYALNVNASAYYNGINVTDGGNASAFNATKSGAYTGIYMEKTSTTSYDPCVWGNSKGMATGVQGNSVTGVGIYGITGNPNNYAGYFLGSVYSTGIFQPSDLALKKDIKDLTKATDIIKQLHPKMYHYKDDGNFKSMNLPKGDRYGLIAEDVEKVLPGLVKETRFDPRSDADIENGKTGGAENFKALNYTELIPIIIKSVQEQQTIIEKQQAVIDRQQQQIDELKQTVRNGMASGTSDSKSAEATGAYLIQNAPNPFSESTTVKCYVPSSVKQSQLALYDRNGKMIKSYTLSEGINTVNIIGGNLASGQYAYSLLADGKKVDTKNLVLTK